MFKKFLPVLSTVVVVAGCSTPAPAPIEPVEVPSEGELEVEVVVPIPDNWVQEELDNGMTAYHADGEAQEDAAYDISEGFITVESVSNPDGITAQDYFDNAEQECIDSFEGEEVVPCESVDLSEWERIDLNGFAAYRSGVVGAPSAQSWDRLFIVLDDRFEMLTASYQEYDSEQSEIAKGISGSILDEVTVEKV